MKRNPRRVWELKIYMFAHALKRGKCHSWSAARARVRGEDPMSAEALLGGSVCPSRVRDSHPHPADVSAFCPPVERSVRAGL